MNVVPVVVLLHGYCGFGQPAGRVTTEQKHGSDSSVSSVSEVSSPEPSYTPPPPETPVAAPPSYEPTPTVDASSGGTLPETAPAPAIAESSPPVTQADLNRALAGAFIRGLSSGASGGGSSSSGSSGDDGVAPMRPSQYEEDTMHALQNHNQ